MTIRVGTLVRLKRGLRARSLNKNETAKVISVIGDIPGGLRLDNRLGGFTMWNIADLERVPRRKRAPKKRKP